ncbi:MAG: molybdenum cofactor biosynthesis protein B [Acidobacteriota bacterium]
MPQARLGNPIREHKDQAMTSAIIAIVTLSSSRSADNDQSGDIIQKLAESKGHKVAVRKLITDSRNVLRATLRELARQKNIHAIITTGGTGLAASDITVETVRGMLDKELPGFNSLFMLLSYPQAKSAAMLSRALAGTLHKKLVFCLPGSPRACRLATAALILPELGHMLKVLHS